MSLDLGTLTGYLELDDKKFDGVLGNLPGKLEFSGAAMKLAAGGLALGVGMALSKGLMDAIELESASDKVAAQLGMTEAESARIGGVAGKLYVDAYGESVEDVSNAVAAVVSSIDGMRGASDAALEAMTAKALTFSGVFAVDVARGTQVVGQLIKGGLVADANEGFDLLTAAMQKVPAGVRESVLDAADEYGPFFASVGMDGAQAFNLLAASAEKGEYGIDKAGDAVKELSIRATDLNDAGAQDALAALGLSGTDMANALLAGGDQAAGAMDAISTALLGVQDPAQQAALATALFGTPLEDLGKDSIPGFLGALSGVNDVLGDTTGRLDEAGKVANGNAAVGWEQLSRTWSSITGTVGAALLPILDAVLSWLNDNPAILAVVATALGVLATAFILGSVAVWAMNSALLANPITWIILAVVALIAAVVLLVTNWDAVVAWISDVWAGFISWFTGVMDGFLSWWNGLWEAVGQFFQDAWDNAVAWVMGVLISWNAWLVGVGEGIASWWEGLWSGVGSFFQGIWDGIVAWAAQTISNFIRGWTIIWGTLTSFFSGLWSGIAGGIQNTWNGVLSFFGGIPGAIMGFFSGIGSWLWNAGRDLIDGLLSGVRSVAGNIGRFFLDILPDWIVGPFKAALGIASPSKVFRSYGRNIVEGLELGLGDEQGALDQRMAGLVGAQDYSAGSAMASALLSPQTAAQSAVEVSLAGARVRLIVGEREFDGYVEGKIGDASEERRTDIVNGAGGVAFA